MREDINTGCIQNDLSGNVLKIFLQYSCTLCGVFEKINLLKRYKQTNKKSFFMSDKRLILTMTQIVCVPAQVRDKHKLQNTFCVTERASTLLIFCTTTEKPLHTTSSHRYMYCVCIQIYSLSRACIRTCMICLTWSAAGRKHQIWNNACQT